MKENFTIKTEFCNNYEMQLEIYKSNFYHSLDDN